MSAPRSTYRVEWGIFGWTLRCIETGCAYPNGVGVSGKPFVHWEDPEKAYRYAKRHRVPMVELVAPPEFNK